MVSDKYYEYVTCNRYIGETEELQAELIEQMMEKDCLMVSGAVSLMF